MKLVKFSKSKRRRRKDEGTISRGWLAVKLVNFLSQKEEVERMKVLFPGVASRKVGKCSKSKRRRRKEEGTFLGDGWPCMVLSQKRRRQKSEGTFPRGRPREYNMKKRKN
jgi:hypothetical protein